MAEIEFIKKDPEQVLGEIIAEYQQRAQAKLQPADPEMILIDCMAYRELVLRAKMEYLMKQNFVQFAEGGHLDNWGMLWGIARKPGETDSDFRKRILAVSKGSIGTVSAYYARIISVAGVSDVIIEQKYQDNTLPPGVIRLIPIRLGLNENMVSVGTVHTPEVEQAILESIQARDFGIIAPVFVFKAANPVPISGTIEVSKVAGMDKEQIRRGVMAKVEAYFGRISQKFENYFGVFDLEKEVSLADGVVDVVNMTFSSVPQKGTGDFYVQGNITIL